MASNDSTVPIQMPALPVPHDQFIPYITTNSDKHVFDLLAPFKQYDAQLRRVFAQQPQHPAAQKSTIVPVYAGNAHDINIRARKLESETEQEKASYIMPLSDDKRRAHGSAAIVQSLQEFRTNFNIFSESALADLDWSNVVVAGSAVVTPLLAVPEKHSGTKRALREYYHEILAPASDVDIFLYGMDEEQAKKKIQQIEQSVRDAILTETTTVRTKNAITIASQYPTRHIQIVLRIYKSVSEILTGFDVDCSCAAYDGKQVYASPRALAAYMTQVNAIDLSRRSPSYENRLSKYAHRGFEVYWPLLDRSRIDPTIFERSFGRTEGLARLLVLEKLPKATDRDAYLDQRRSERGRPAINRWAANNHKLRGNIKNDWEDEVAEWVDAEEVSNYHTFTVPYGPKFHARKIEKLLFTKDLLLNAEWNTPKDRDVNLHRHPAFFGRAEDVFGDCCGGCPEPTTIEEKEVAEEEDKIYISGSIKFIKDDPGRQTIGSFNPLSPEDWTNMAYVGNTERLCQAIVDNDSEYVRTWLEQEGNDPNTRDYTGRTPLHLAVSSSTPDIVQCLIDHGARIVARLVDGKTALHLAAIRGSVEMVSALLRKSEANEELEEAKVSARRAAQSADRREGTPADMMKDVKISGEEEEVDEEDSDIDMIDEDEASDDDVMDATTERSMVKIRQQPEDRSDQALDKEDEDQPDVYDVNVLAWDTAVSPLHLAIVNGHIDVVKCLVQDFGADVLLPIKLFNAYSKAAEAAILTLVLAMSLPIEKANAMTQALIELGASSAQADLKSITALQYAVAAEPKIIDVLVRADPTGVKRAINHLTPPETQWSQGGFDTALMTAIKAKDAITALKLLAHGASATIDKADCLKAAEGDQQRNRYNQWNMPQVENTLEQPVIQAAELELPGVVMDLVQQYGVDVNTLARSGWQKLNDQHGYNRNAGKTLLDVVGDKLKTLKEWEHKPQQFNAPCPLESDAHYLSEFEEGTYAYWEAQRQLAKAKESYERDLKIYNENIKRTVNESGLAEKTAAIHAMIAEFEQLETLLTSKGAKKFKDLYPEIETPPNNDTYYKHHPYTPPKPVPFKVEFSFRAARTYTNEHNEERKARYMKLFEATWKGDTQTVKELTLLPWKNDKDEPQAPLRITDMGSSGMTAFAIAVVHGNLALASIIMEIAQAQYMPREESKKERYTLGNRAQDDSDYDSEAEGDQDEPQIFSQVVDEQFTIETIGEVSTQVRSEVEPLAMLSTLRYPLEDFLANALRNSSGDGKGFSYFGLRTYSMHGKRTNTGSLKPSKQNPLSEEKRKSIGDANTLIQFALHSDDSELLEFLLALGEQYTKIKLSTKSDDQREFFSLNDDDFVRAIQLDKPHLLAEMIARTGAGLPIQRLIKESGVKDLTKPKFYQGLSVRGKKRKDWAAAGRKNIQRAAVIEDCSPPLLIATRWASIATVEWLLSDAPVRCYEDFAANYKNDKRIKLLSEAKGGFSASVSEFLNARSHLALHCCVLGEPTPESARLLQYLIKVMPKELNAKSLTGMTPLLLAFSRHRHSLVKILIEAGADQSCRDGSGRNVMHCIVSRTITKDKWLQKARDLVGLIDPKLLPGLCEERCSAAPGAATPLAQCVQRSRTGEDSKYDIAILDLLLKHGQGKGLNIVTGEGDTPLHVAVRTSKPEIAAAIIAHDPTLILRENATGRTPFEMAQDRDIARYCAAPPTLPGNWEFSQRRARRWRVHRDWHDYICNRSLDAFSPRAEGQADDQSAEEKIWTLLKKTLADLQQSGDAKRRIVTLNEANEVAKRLAAAKSTNARRARKSAQQEEEAEDSDGEEQKKMPELQDEVDKWA